MTVLSFARRGLSALLVAAACLIAQAATAQTFSAANWEAFAALNGGSPNNQVRALAEYQGDLYVGGTFAQVGGQQVYYVARWNGYRWEKLGDGVNNAVYAMTVYDGKLIVGGSFTTASGVSALRIASWDGAQWAPLGDGLNSSVVDLTVYNGELIAGGIFTSAGGQSVNRIARWDGSNWHAMGGPDHGTVNSVSEFNGDLIVVGSFYMVNGENHNYITRWDGSSWSSLGEGLNTTVNDAVTFQGKLYATGQFTGSGGSGLPYIAVWDGSTWSPVGGGLSDAGYSLYADNDRLYVGGQFETADGISSLGIAAWDGSSWQAVGDGLGLYAGTVIRLYRITKFNNEIVVGGLLDKNGAVNLVRLNNGSAWQAFQSAFVDGPTRVAAEHDGDVIVGGDFTQISGVAANRIARWDGSQWHALGDGFNSVVTSIVSYQGELYAAGAFDHSGSDPITGVARWDNDAQTWQPLAAGVNGTVTRLKEIGNELWVLGEFSAAGGESASGMARWDGSQWLSVDFPYQVHYGPTDVVEYQDEVVVGGRFYNPEGFLLFKVVAFDGEQWYPLELDAVTGMVQSMVVHDDVLYVTGNIYRMNESISASGVAAWDGSQWSNVGDSDVGSGKTLQSFKETLFLGSDSGLYVLKDGTFQQPDTSVNQLINGLGIAGDSLYLAGAFSSAGGQPAQNLARLIPNVALTLDAQAGDPAETTRYFPDTTIPLPRPQRDGYLLEGWNTASDGSGTGYTDSLPLGGTDQTLYAQWQLEVYTVSFDTDGGEALDDLELAPDATINAPTPVREGHTFLGWQPALPATMPRTDLAVTAQWQVNQYTLTFNSNGGSSVGAITQNYGSAVTAPTAPVLEGYTFAGWSPALPATVPAQDLTLTAQWQVNQYTLTFDSNGGTAVGGITQNYGSAVTIPAAPTREGHTFTGWSPAVPATVPAGNLTLTAQWQVNQYTLTFDSNGGTAVGALTQDYGSAVNAPAAPSREGHTFTGWSPSVPATVPAQNLTLTAQWQVNQYTLTFDSNGGTAVGALTQDYGSAVTAPAAPTREGHTFNGWSPSVPATVPAQNLTLTAQWEVNQYTITFDSNGGSAVDALTLDYASAVTAPDAPTRKGYAFTGWSPALPATVPARDLTVTAQWSVNAYTLTFDSAGGTAVAPLTQDYGTAITAPAAPQREFHVFQGWSPAVPATMPAANQVLTAVWQEFTRYTAAVVVQGEGQVSPASQTLYQTQSAQFTLTLNDPDDYVTVNGCGAALAGGLITTAPLTASCTVQVGIFPSTQPEKDKEGPLASAESVRFRLQGGAGEKALSSVYLMRAGVDAPLFGDDMNTLLTLNEDGSYTFVAERTGRYTLLFSDAVSGEITEVTIDVLPYLAFTSSHRRALREDTSALTLWLSDEPIEYPVTATLNGSDMGFESQSVSLFENDARRLELAVPTGAGDTAAVDLTDLDSALPGNPVQQALTLQSDPLPLSLELTVTQGLLMDTRVVGRDRGTVIIHVDAGGAQVDQYDWQAENLPLSSNGNQAAFNLETLEAGSYEIAVTATTADTRGVALATLQVVETCPTEGCYALAQRVPPSANPFADEPHRLALCPGSRVSLCGGEQKAYLETAGPFRLALGTTSSNQSWASGEFALGVSDGSLPRDNAYLHQGVAVDFEIQALDQPGETVPVAIPLVGDTVIPAGAVWRKYLNGGWHLFLEDAFNQLHSAPKNGLGLCPVVSADSWTPGLTEGDACVRLMIQDGGPNDADGQADGVIRDPGTLAVKRADEARPEDLWGGGGAAGGLMVGLLSLLALRRRRVGAA
ncbi:MAG: InlB B-repeat-containing protein [Alcanivorax sp.]|nr:InlB B-repeat-containing protein [Alcanivorax sp.]